jgi:hypothetical protein
MQFLLDHHVNFTEHEKQTRFVVQKVSCQLDKWLWSYELKQQLFCSSGFQKTFYFSTFLGWIFFHKFLTKFLNMSST